MTASPYELVRLKSGGCSIRSLADRETFHPVAGPETEAAALYVDQLELPRRLHEIPGEFVIWDVGLGAAANPITAIRRLAGHPARLRICSFDRTAAALAFAVQHSADLRYLQGFESPLRTLVATNKVSWSCDDLAIDWTLHLADFPATVASAASHLRATDQRLFPAPHAIFYDAFSPARNAEMWTAGVLSNVFALIAPERPCSLATFSRSTMARTALLLAGFFVGNGATIAGKEETTVAANDPRLLRALLDESWLRRAERSHAAEPLYEGHYRTLPLAPETLRRLLNHPQFRKNSGRQEV